MVGHLRRQHAFVAMQQETDAVGKLGQRTRDSRNHHGRPVVAADLGGPVETVRHGDTGWRVPPNDPDALAAAIGVALDLDPDARLALGERARASVPTVRSMQDATLDVYETVLTEGARIS